jgi:hypothetical protein
MSRAEIVEFLKAGTRTGKIGRPQGRQPGVSLCVDSEEPPYAYVRIDGTVELVDDLELLRTWATRLGGRYMGAERAEEFGRRNGVPGELLARLTPTHIVGRAEIAAAPS